MGQIFHKIETAQSTMSHARTVLQAVNTVRPLQDSIFIFPRVCRASSTGRCIRVSFGIKADQSHTGSTQQTNSLQAASISNELLSNADFKPTLIIG
jgi:hypothetical protein